MPKLLFAILISFIALPSYANATVKVGDMVPTIKLYDQYGGQRMWDDLKGEKGVVLVFFRSADWCPYCQAQLIDLRNNKEKFEKAGYSIVGVSYDSIEKLKKFDDKRALGFALLSDSESKLIMEFGIFDTSYVEGSFAYGVPRPTVYVVGKDGAVDAILAEETYKTRPQVDSIMEAIKAANN